MKKEDKIWLIVMAAVAVWLLILAVVDFIRSMSGA